MKNLLVLFVGVIVGALCVLIIIGLSDGSGNNNKSKPAIINVLKQTPSKSIPKANLSVPDGFDVVTQKALVHKDWASEDFVAEGDWGFRHEKAVKGYRIWVNHKGKTISKSVCDEESLEKYLEQIKWTLINRDSILNK